MNKPEIPAKSALLLRKTTPGPKPAIVQKPTALTNANGGFESKILSKFTASAAEVNENDSDSSEENYKSDEEQETTINTVKRVSVEAVENIRAGGTSVQFNFKANETIQGHLPAMNVNKARPSPSTKPLGVIKPITKFEETQNNINRMFNKPEPPAVGREYLPSQLSGQVNM